MNTGLEERVQEVFVDSGLGPEGCSYGGVVVWLIADTFAGPRGRHLAARPLAGRNRHASPACQGVIWLA
jgi:hypothetical protein